MSEIITFAPTTAGGGNEFVIPFPYLEQAHVKLYVNGVEDTGKQFPSDGMIKASVAITAGDIVVVKRETPRSALIRTLPDTGTLSSDDVNHQSLQAVYVATEAADGLREGLALDDATETYWEGAPTGTNRTMKNLVDPSAAQEAATKGWYDTQLSTHATNAAASATTASTKASEAATDAASATSSATTASSGATAATASASAAAASDATLDGIKLWADNAEEWAIKAEDSLISTGDSGGDGVSDYSAFHHAQKAAPSATSAAASEATALSVAAQATPYLSSILLGDELGIAINWAGGNVSVTGDNDPAAHPRVYNMPIQEYGDTYFTNWYIASNDYNNYDRQGYWADYGTPQNHYYPTIGHPNTTYDGLRIGYSSQRGSAQFLGLPSNPGNSTWYGSTTNCTDAGTSAVQKMLSRGATIVTMTASGGGLNYYTEDQIGRSGVVVTAGRKTWLQVMLQYGDWNDFIVEVNFGSNSTNYKSGVIDLNSGGTPTYSAGDFTNAWRYQLKYGWWMFIFEVPAQLSDSSHTTDYVRTYFTDGTDLTPATGGDGTSHVYMGYTNLQYTPSMAVLHNGSVNSNASDASMNMETQKGAAGGFEDVFGMEDQDVMMASGATFWSTLFLSGGDASFASGAGGENPDIVGYRELGRGIYVRYAGASDELQLVISDTNVTSASVITLQSLTVDATDNDFLGTKINLVLTFKDDVYNVYWKINGGTKQSYTHTEVTNTDWGSNSNPSAWFPGFYNDSGIQLSGTIRFSGFFKRNITSDEADRYLNWT